MRQKKTTLPHQVLPRQRLKTLCQTKRQIWMGIINLSPNSFSQDQSIGSMHTPMAISEILLQAESFIANGADILDIGAIPSNPAVVDALIDPSQELQTLFPVLHAIKSKFGSNVLISVDTYSPTVAYTLAQDYLVDIVNDIYGGRKTETIVTANEQAPRAVTMMDIVAQFSLGYILMHMSGSLESLQNHISTSNTTDYLNAMLSFFQERKNLLMEKGIDFCLFDPGIGGGRFGKNLDINRAILSKKFLTQLRKFGFPILVGLSRKGFLGEIYPECTTPLSRDNVSKKWEKICFKRGVSVIRTHTL